MSQRYEGLPIEEPVASPVAQQLLHEISTARYPSQLRKLGGVALFHKFRTGEITDDERTIMQDEIAARRKSLTMPTETEPAEDPAIEPADWSPTDILDRLPKEPREFDHAERAAGEYLDRD